MEIDKIKKVMMGKASREEREEVAPPYLVYLPQEKPPERQLNFSIMTRESGRPPLSAHLVKISHGRNRRKIIIIFRKKTVR